MKSSSALCSRLVQLLMLTCVLASIAHAQKIKVEYNKDLDFSKFKTFAWGHHDAVSRPTLALAIAGAIEEEMTKRGLRKVEDNPDVYIKMYGSVDSEMSVSYSDPLYLGMGGIPPFDTAFIMWGSPAERLRSPFTKVSLSWMSSMPARKSWRGAAWRPRSSATRK